MNKSILIIFSCISMILGMSCSDIIDARNNLVKERIPTIFTRDDSLSALKFAQINLGNIKKPRIIFFPVKIENIAPLDTIVIYSLKVNNNLGISISPSVKFPIILLPNTLTGNTQIQIIYDTLKVPAGTYTYKIFINGSNMYFIIVTVTVTN